MACDHDDATRDKRRRWRVARPKVAHGRVPGSHDQAPSNPASGAAFLQQLDGWHPELGDLVYFRRWCGKSLLAWSSDNAYVSAIEDMLGIDFMTSKFSEAEREDVRRRALNAMMRTALDLVEELRDKRNVGQATRSSSRQRRTAEKRRIQPNLLKFGRQGLDRHAPADRNVGAQGTNGGNAA